VITSTVRPVSTLRRSTTAVVGGYDDERNPWCIRMYSIRNRLDPSTQRTTGSVASHVTEIFPSRFETPRPVCDPCVVCVERKDTCIVERIDAGRFPKEGETTTTTILYDVSGFVSASAGANTSSTAAPPLPVPELPPDMSTSESTLCL
jgi:hypothetical protein